MDTEKTPHWVILNDYVIGSYIFCSECLEGTKKMTNFCRKCGADMRKRKENNGKTKA